MTITCFIRYEIDPFRRDAFAEYGRQLGQVIPRLGGDLIGYFAPHEGSLTTGYAAYHIDSLAEYEAYRGGSPPMQQGARRSSLRGASSSSGARTASS